MKQTMRGMLSLTILLGMLATAAWGGQPTTQWAVSAGYPGTPSKVVTDAQGNVYVTGSTYSADTNNTTSTADMLTVKYDSKGVKLWEATYNSPLNTGFDAGYNLVVDTVGNVYVAGTSATSPAYYIGVCSTVVKYSPAGEELWAARYADSAFGSHYGGLDIDAAGNVYVSLSTIYDSAYNSTAIDGVIVKYDANGNRVWKYLMAIGHYGDDWASKVMVKNGFVYVAGTFNGGDHGYGDNMRNSMVWKFTLDGQLVWKAIHDGGGADYFGDFAVDGQDNVYIASSSDRLLTGWTMWDTYRYDMATAKFDANGQLVWNSRYNNAGAGNHGPSSIAVNAGGDVYVTGNSDGDGTTGTDLVTVKYRGADGAQLWVDRYNGTANDNELGGIVLIDNKGDVYVSGTSVNSGTGQDFTIIKYGPDGTRQWAELYNGAANGNDSLASMTLDAQGNIIVTGASTDAGGIPRYLTIKYATALNVSIDIKPGSYPNVINIGWQGSLPVAIFGSDHFNVRDIDPATLELNGLKVKAVGKSNKLLSHYEYVNNDGYEDLVVQFDHGDNAFSLGDAIAELTGKLYDGTLITGSDAISIVP
jgi:hypothetical protein